MVKMAHTGCLRRSLPRWEFPTAALHPPRQLKRTTRGAQAAQRTPFPLFNNSTVSSDLAE